VLEQFLNELTEKGFDAPVRSLYFFWVDRYIVEHKEITKEGLQKFVKKMVDGKFIHDCEFYDFSAEQYLLVCKFSLNLYEIVFFLPSREGYLSGKKYFMRIKGKVDLVSLRKLFKVFQINLRG
jgi:hypothetical protein